MKGTLIIHSSRKWYRKQPDKVDEKENLPLWAQTTEEDSLEL